MNRSPAHGSVFASDWLGLREPVDHRSRPDSLARAAAQWLARRAQAQTSPPSIIDIGCGRGSNGRYLASFMPTESAWTLLDQDPDLLEQARGSLHTGHRPGAVTTRRFDLAEPPGDAIRGGDLVTASALLDLVSTCWVGQWVEACRREEAALLCALSVNGQIGFQGPADAEDAVVLRQLAVDQQRDKGLGMALGTGVPRVLVNTLATHGYAVTAMPSNWQLSSHDASLAWLLLAGWAQAAAGAQAGCYDAWAGRRYEALATGELTLTVGHVDVLGLPGPAYRSKSNNTSAPMG